MRTIETQLFLFSELSDTAKEIARNWTRDNYGFMSDDVIDDFKQIAIYMGIQIDQVFFSGFCSQGDGACFTGTYSHNPAMLQQIKDHAPLDETLYSIASNLSAAQGRHGNMIHAEIVHNGRYFHENTMSFSVWNDDDLSIDCLDVECHIIDNMKALAKWLYRALEKEYDYQQSNEYLDGCMNANAYEFTANGEIFN